jgi:tRNA threonylcarbamoyladenosine biosynthesis protein TsaE
MNRIQRARQRDQGSLVLTSSESETEELGARLGERLPIPSVVLLRGALGTGKTTFARGVARGLGVNDPAAVSSPSFTLVNVYRGRCPVYHVDLYRLSGDRELYSTGLDEFLGGDGVTVIEWSERIGYPIPSAIEVNISDVGDDQRNILIRCPKTRAIKLQDRKKAATTALAKQGR